MISGANLARNVGKSVRLAERIGEDLLQEQRGMTTATIPLLTAFSIALPAA